MSDESLGRRILRVLMLAGIAVGSFVAVVVLAQLAMDLLRG